MFICVSSIYEEYYLNIWEVKTSIYGLIHETPSLLCGLVWLSSLLEKTKNKNEKCWLLVGSLLRIGRRKNITVNSLLPWIIISSPYAFFQLEPLSSMLHYINYSPTHWSISQSSMFNSNRFKCVCTFYFGLIDTIEQKSLNESKKINWSCSQIFDWPPAKVWTSLLVTNI